MKTHEQIRTQRQLRLLKDSVELPGTAKDLVKELRSYLLKAVEEEVLSSSIGDILKFLKMEPNNPKNGEKVLIFGGDIDFKRTGSNKRFIRHDDACFNFQLTVIQSKNMLSLVAYDFEIQLNNNLHEDAFMRFDLNIPGHDNETHGLRAHIHPSCDDLHVPSAIFSPIEMLSFFIYEYKLRKEKP